MRKILTFTAVGLLALSGQAAARDEATPLEAKFDQMAVLMDEMGADERADGVAVVSSDVDATAPADQTAQDDADKQDPRKARKFWRKGAYWRKGAFWQGGAGSVAFVSGVAVSSAVIVNAIDDSKSG